MTRPPTTRPTYAEASKALLRNTVLDAMRDLLADKDWAAITMADVATFSGVSRQTVYNEFRSRNGLAQAYALRLVDDFVALLSAAVTRNEDDVRGALREGFGDYFRTAADDPLIRSLLSGAAKPDLLRLITTDAGPLIESATRGLSETMRNSWLGLGDDDAERISRAASRMALSYVAMPPEGDRDVATDLAEVLAPALILARSR